MNKPNPRHVGNWIVTRKRYVWQLNDNGGRTKIENGQERVTVDLSVDMDALATFMAARAAHSKGGKSVLQDGLVVARVLSRERIADAPEGGPA